MLTSRKNRIIIGLSLVLVILAIPVIMTIRAEMHLSNTDHEYKFRIAPVDPSDPVRGAYLHLEYPGSWNVPVEKADLRYGHVIVEKDSAGWAFFKEVKEQVPNTSNYFSTEVRSYGMNGRIKITFDRYFINENLSELGESEYERLRDLNTDDFYSIVTIHEGTAILKEVYYKDQTFRDYLKERSEEIE